LPGGFLPTDEVEELHLFEADSILEPGRPANGVLPAVWHDLELLFGWDFFAGWGKVLLEEVQS